MPNTPVDEKLLEVHDYQGLGYHPLIDYGAWRVALMRYEDDLLPQNLAKMERHDETDEVFVLLAGRCILFLGAGKDQVTGIFAQDMEPLKLYNVKRSAWHTHTLSKDCCVLIVENRDTVTANSAETVLSDQQRAQLVKFTETLWQPA